MLQKDSGKNKPTGFDFTDNMTLLVQDIVQCHPVFSHINTENVFIAISASNGSKNGVLAKLRPLRFEGGEKTKTIRGREYRATNVEINGNDILYVVYFHLPRFLNHGDYMDKLATVFHELYHISPLFNGDIRRFPGKNFAHGNSRKKYNEIVKSYTEEYISPNEHNGSSEFLKYDYSGLKRKYGAIYGDMIRIPASKPGGDNRLF